MTLFVFLLLAIVSGLNLYLARAGFQNKTNKLAYYNAWLYVVVFVISIASFIYKLFL
jgi:hypothetical protein